MIQKNVMNAPSLCRLRRRLLWSKSKLSGQIGFAATCVLLMVTVANAEERQAIGDSPSHAASTAAAADSNADQATREAAFAKLLSGATLDGNFTMTGPGQDATKLMHDKYTLGDVKKLAGKNWLIPTRIQYGDRDFTVPLTLPVEWAGDTPVIVVDNVGLPGLGSVSARVMFFADHYAGFWQHGTSTGHLFGVVRHDEAKSERPDSGTQ
jgi:hypothetical protein